ncbi:MAG: class I SAM-dependent DNA methyltransferase [Pseudohongiellaceae bacterium]
MDLTGIENEAEFFPAGTLSEVLAAELADITAQWGKADKTAHPVERIASVGDRVMSLLSQLRNSNDRSTRQDLHQQIGQALTAALGYNYKRETLPTVNDDGGIVSVINRTFDGDGRCQLWIIDTPVAGSGDEDADPLGIAFSAEQFDDDVSESLNDLAIEEVIAEGIFAQADAPRYLLIAGTTQWVLVDSRKWPARSVLRFNLQEIFSRQDKDTYRVMACLISCEARVPHAGAPLSDRLEEEAQRNANAVTSSLKRTVRDAIEILGQEVLDVTAGKFPSGERRGLWIDGETLSLECLRYMYRMLFLLYAESNPRLGILDIRDPVYAGGYSMEALRELESVKLRAKKDKEGTYLWESLQQTLGFLYSGEPHCLKLPAVKVSLLDPDSTPLLNSVKLRNEAVQKIIRLLSLRQSKKSTGRISYAKLGIGQLGAVYETLISFTGTVCKEDMIEIKGDAKDRAASVELDQSEDTESGEDVDAESDALGNEEDEGESRVDKVDVLAPTYFVPRRRINEFNPEAVVFVGSQAKIYPKGSFTYRLAGRDREKTAAYYTPEPLARLLVKHLIMERCEDLKADELLELKILEPAMGSAAFLVETTNQLADLYLERKQKEVGRTIPQEDVVIEKQRVRSYIADRNCFGVDLNPTAVELGAISLWLNGLHKGDFSPWFGDQLHAGNSLIGARRAVYSSSQLKGRTADLWFNQPPKELGWKEPRAENSVFQWLLPAKDMAAFEKDKSIKAFAGEHQAQLKKWRSSDFFKPLETHEISLVKRLSQAADELFSMVADELKRTRELANDQITLWPEQTMQGVRGVDFHKKEILRQRLMGEDHAHNTLPFKRLKTAMDAWCALWLWPIELAHKLPSRQEFLEGMRVLLEGGFSADGSLSLGEIDDFAVSQEDLFNTEIKDTRGAYNTSLFQETNVEALAEEYDWLGVAIDVSSRARFTHYDLLFADILRERQGFDLIVGNPPWQKPSWKEGQVIATIDPLYAGLSAAEAKKLMVTALEKSNGESAFLREYASTKGAMSVNFSEYMNPYAGGGQNNLYRCFIDLAFRLLSQAGAAALIHQDGHLKEGRSSLRPHWYARISKHFEFSNKLTQKNFSEVLDTRRFSLNIYRGTPSEVSFHQFTNAFVASQIDESYAHDGLGLIPPLRNDDNSWNTQGHRNRLYVVSSMELAIFKKVLSTEDEGQDARLIQLLSVNQLEAIKTFSDLSSIACEYRRLQVEPMFHESGSQNDEIIVRKTSFPDSVEDFVLSGPNIYISNPLAKCARRVCKNHQHYDSLDLSKISENYIPRSNFKICQRESLPKLDLNPSVNFSSVYRLAFRRRVDTTSERSFACAIIPPGVTHIAGVHSAAFENHSQLLNACAFMSALPFDFLFRCLGKGDVGISDFLALPILELNSRAKARVLQLNCLTDSYSQLWRESLEMLPTETQNLVGFGEEKSWRWGLGLRRDLERRSALIELDVLVAQSLGWTLDMLLDVYLMSFPVLRMNERSTWFDQDGQIVWSVSKVLSGVGFLNKRGKNPGFREWQSILAENPAELVCTAVDDTKPDGPHTVERRFAGPFFTCDRAEDYKRTWAHFEKADLEGAE